MSKLVSPKIATGQFVVGRSSGIAFNAVEGLRETPRVARIRKELDQTGETGSARRRRIETALKAKPLS